MKLSELIAFRNRLDELAVSEAQELARRKLDIIMHLVEQPVEQPVEALTEPFMNQLHQREAEIHQAFDNFGVEINRVKQRVYEQIAEQERHWFQESYRLFEDAEMCETTDHILNNRTVAATERTIESYEVLYARLSAYSDWRFPGMIIRPAKEDFIESMVGLDPLYLVDRNYDLLEPALDRFPKLYKNRLRPYTVNDWSDEPLLGKIPNDQFGICLAYNVFNYRPFEIIRKYLTEVYEKLRPGGVLIMTYNDCDRASAVMLVERYATSYTPGNLILELVKNIGFELVYTWDDGGPSVWLELRKPGELTTTRGGQVVATIQTRYGYLEDVDFLRRKTYNKEEVAKIQEQASLLNIDRKIIKRSKPFELQVLINDILAEQKEKLLQERENQRIADLTEVAKGYNIDINDPTWQAQVEKRQLKEEAISFGIDISQSNWEEIHTRVLHEREQERERLAIERARMEEERERKRVEELHERAKAHGVDPTIHPEIEVYRLIAEAVDQQKKEEIKWLRQRATELQVGDPNMVRYGYSAEKLKQLIKEKEEGTS